MKKAFIEINGKLIDYCDYKNCKNFQAVGYIVCKKHIGQTIRDEKSEGMQKLRRRQSINRFISTKGVYVKG